MVRLPELLEIAGAALIVAGLALWAVPAALIVAGLFLVAAASASPSDPGRDAAVRHEKTRAGR